MNILNFGSLNLDYIYRVDSFLRPGETKAALSLAIHCGGKGLNQSIALAKAGAPVHHAGCVGDGGETLLAALEGQGVGTRHVRKLEGSTGHAIIQVDGSGQNCILLHGGANRRMNPEMVPAVLGAFSAGDVVLLQNEINLTPLILEEAHARGMQVALNPSPMDDGIRSLPLEKLTWLILNELEGADLTGRTRPEEILAALGEQYPGLRVVLTLGKDGVLYRDENETLFHPIFPVQAVDTTGAGDAFTGFFLAGALRRLPVKESLRLASAAAAISITRLGAGESVPTLAEVEAAFPLEN